jgi:hypothetical protein
VHKSVDFMGTEENYVCEAHLHVGTRKSVYPDDVRKTVKHKNVYIDRSQSE